MFEQLSSWNVEVPREDLPNKIKKYLERLEDDAGVVWDDIGRQRPSNPTYLIWGSTIDGLRILYVNGTSVEGNVWMNDRNLKPSEALSELKERFTWRIGQVKHWGDTLKVLGADTEGLGLNEMDNMEEIFREMGMDIPKIKIPEDEILTKEEKNDLAKKWGDWRETDDRE